MKKIFLYVILFNFFVNAQHTLTQGEINDFYITPLDSTYDLFGTIDQIIRLNLVEALPKIEQNFWNQSCENQQWFLQAMSSFNSSLTYEYCLRFLDSLSSYGSQKYNDYNCKDILRAKVDVIELLYKLNDFSRVEEVFELIERDNIQEGGYSYAVTFLPSIFKNRTDYKEQAKQVMMAALNNTEDDYSVFAYTLTLTQAFGEQEIPEMVQLFKTLTNPQAKRGILEFYFSRFEDKFNLNGLVRETLLTEPNSELRLYLSKVLILGFATPSDYIFVGDYLQNEPNDTIKGLMQLEIDTFQPPEPDSTATVLNLLNNLIELTDSISNYTWLGDLQFKDELQSKLQSTKTNLQNGDSLTCAVQVKTFQDLVNNVCKDSLNQEPRFVTLEGWKFLYWNAQYVLDRLPEIPPIPNVLEIIPSLTTPNNSGFTMIVSGTNFTINSVVFWNGMAKSTGYLSDSSLTLEINPGDVSSTGNLPVWVKEQVLSSDTLEFRIVNSLPESVEPVVECLRDNGDGSYTAYYGYSNNNNESVFIPISSHNKISPSPWDRGQPGVFLIGRVENVFTVDFNTGNIIWHLNNQIAKANKNTVSCP